MEIDPMKRSCAWGPLAALAFAGLVCFGRPVEARDLALVIGNNEYRNAPQLEKAVNDARAIAAALKRTGFDVSEAENLDQRAMSRALVDFEATIETGDRALFYFSGHGVALEGLNYLLPTDVPAAEGRQADLIRDASFAVDRIVDGLRDHGARVAILVLDACRNDPFAGPATRGSTLTRGLVRIEPPEGVFVLMSAGLRQAALDRLSDTDPDPDSVFTRTFLRELRPGRTLVEIAKRTQIGVKALASSVGFEQVPAYSDQVVGDIMLTEADRAPASAGPAADEDPLHVSGNVPTRIVPPAGTNFGSGVVTGPGVTIGPGVLIGGKDPKTAIGGPPAAAPKPADVAALAIDPKLGAVSGGIAPIASFMRSNAGWTVSLSSAEPAVSIGYRLGDTGEFHDTGLLDVLDPRTGQRMPNPSFQLSGRAKAAVIEVRYGRADGSTAGPFPIRFDPEVALFDFQRKALSQIWPSWVEFREFNGLLVYFTTLVTYRCAITEVRYGLDGAAPLSRFDLPSCTANDPFSVPPSAKLILKVPPSTKSIALQITWKDGTRSDVNTIER
jgi:hypothetical protein